MSNFKSKTQLPTTENVRKRGDVLEASGYRAGVANGPHTIFANLGAAPDAADLPDGTPIMVVSGSNLNMHVSVSGSYVLVV